MVDITSLKVRLARLRLGSEFEDKHPELKDPASDSLDKKRGKKKAKKASKDKEKVRGSYNRTKRQEGSTQDYKKLGFGEYTKNTGDKRKKKNKLTRSDQKRGKQYENIGPDLGVTKLPQKLKKKKTKGDGKSRRSGWTVDQINKDAMDHNKAQDELDYESR